MHPLYLAYMDRLEELHRNIETALDGLTPEALDWSPGPGMNSITVLVTHLTCAERFWVGDVLAGDPSGRVREAEFETRGFDASHLKARLAASRSYIRNVLERLPLEALEEQRPARDGHEFSGAWCLLHALEHTAIHVGHVQMNRQLWEERKK
jgi:uncharacterized damage-inducible protein DinB